MGSAHHELVKWLAELLKPVSNYFSAYCVSGIFTFSEFIRNCSINSNNKILVSLDIVSLSTNTPHCKKLHRYLFWKYGRIVAEMKCFAGYGKIKPTGILTLKTTSIRK